ncbi:HRDC domain-containing protein [Bacteroides sp. UBA939]|uniref:HRDC domain-containing protein n=1 Tax=Bacteroides sp. UBA939 TaxID=1946092 RepID=UPI0025C445DB|nr:HRDC domain-containing protein [Bacteroides sp. UBA939]
MQIRIFNIPLTDTGENLAEMNRFLAGCKVLEVEQRFFQNEKGGGWSFCIRYIDSGTNNTIGQGSGGSKGKVDYKNVLSESEFAVFSRLREIRKALAHEDGIPAYAVFIDEELAGMARLPKLTESAVAAIPGIGEKKMAKYGKTMIEQYNKEV